jgi:uncharacterized protein YndB with AHSA1/START domain
MTSGSMRNLMVASRCHGSLSATVQLQEVAVPVVERDVVLPVTRERAWELITEPGELEEWLADEVEFEAEEGAPLRVTWEDGDSRDGVVEAVEVEERVVFRWGDTGDDATSGSRVEWRLDDHPDGTRFTVTEHRFADDACVWGPSLSALADVSARALA